MKKMNITVTGETVEIIEYLCSVTGLTPPTLVALLLRKSGRELELWVSSPVSSASFQQQTSSPDPALSNHHIAATPQSPPDPEDDWKPIEL